MPHQTYILTPPPPACVVYSSNPIFLFTRVTDYYVYSTVESQDLQIPAGVFWRRNHSPMPHQTYILTPPPPACVVYSSNPIFLFTRVTDYYVYSTVESQDLCTENAETSRCILEKKPVSKATPNMHTTLLLASASACVVVYNSNTIFIFTHVTNYYICNVYSNTDLQRQHLQR